MMHTYGVNNNSMGANPFQRSEEMDRATIITRNRNASLMRIEKMEAELEKEKAYLKRCEKEIFELAREELKKHQYNRDAEMSKKMLIINFYKLQLPVSKIIEATGCSSSYVYKILSEYRNKEGLEPRSKKEATVHNVVGDFKDGLTPRQIALKNSISEQYVYKILKEKGLGNN